MDYLTFPDYLARPEMSGSTMAHGLTSMKQLKHVIDHGYQIPASVTRAGTALHSIVEFLPEGRFDEYFVVQPDYHLSPDNATGNGKPSTSKNTVYVKEMVESFAASETREVLTRAEYTRIVRMLRAISANDEAMRLIKDAQRELSVFGEIDNLPCKGRVDGLSCSGTQWNLKTTNCIIKRQFLNLASRLHYPFKDAFHRELLRWNDLRVDRFAYIVVLDSRPVDGQYREAADCVVVNVPEIVLDNQVPLINKVIRQYQDCQKSGVWTGLDGYNYEPPVWDMSEDQFEDQLV